MASTHVATFACHSQGCLCTGGDEGTSAALIGSCWDILAVPGEWNPLGYLVKAR